MIPSSSFLVPPRPKPVETSLSPASRPTSASILLPHPLSRSSGHITIWLVCLHLVLHTRAVDSGGLVFFIDSAHSLSFAYVLLLSQDTKLTASITAMVVLSVATYLRHELHLVGFLPSLSTRVVAMQMMPIMRCTTDALAEMIC